MAAAPPTVDAYGAPSYGAGGPFEGQTYHTPENADPSIESAIAIARWQAGPGNTSGGSYHAILGHRGSDPWASCENPDHWPAARSVRWDLAAGGISTNRDPAVWRPDRYAVLKRLSARAYGDPNRYMHQLALSGKAAQYTAAGYPLGLRLALVRWIRLLEKAYNYDAILNLHRYWQVNRSDPGPVALIPALLELYNEAPPMPEPTTTYRDVPTTHRHYGQIEWLHDNGLATFSGRRGYFDPDGAATRAEIAVQLRRFHELIGAQAQAAVRGAEVQRRGTTSAPWPPHPTAWRLAD